MSQIHGQALGTTDGGHGGGAARRQGQPLARNRAPGPGEVDGERVAQGLQLRNRRRRHGIPD